MTSVNKLTSAAGITELYYSLLDLDDKQKNRYLENLQTQNPELHQELMTLFAVESDSILTELLNFNICSSGDTEVDYTHQQIDKYLLTHELGRGGMGVVYAACRADRRFEQKLAIKFLHPHMAQIFDETLLFSEAQLLANLNHPNIAKVFDGGMHGKQVYIVMEYIEGKHLAEFLLEQPLCVQDRLRLFCQICNGIEHTHQQGIVHGDLKPENVLIDARLNAKLIDFNLTQKLDRREAPIAALSKQYASPEQLSGLELTAASDIYSLGQLLKWLFPNQSPTSDIALIQTKATQSQASLRYSSAMALQNDIENILSKHPISLRKKELVYTGKRLFQRHPLSSSLALILLLGGTLFSTVLVGKNQQLAKEKRIAENLIFEVTSMVFDAKSEQAQSLPANVVLDLTRRRILSNPEIPKHIKQKMLLAMLTPAERHRDNQQQNTISNP
ncbi:serine/threonine protein kinase [Vibrio ponticus]|uniref:serine/threonine protein kinase n=1 Tax=Vibrio ponticus TaxID=265668 RepID=UPI0021A8EDD1|nr:serine/threonine-protein kinase [Vibrio ponticus]